ncbi:MAG: class II fructose-bisphosphate aldolase [Clostridiales bacterium]|jgi:ketose-bisphosphate aldolase|nr:class II fructose-bisphosphate aldolase [Clostridiales bacterium]
MTGDKLHELIQKADKGGYAIVSFNYSDIWDFLSIIEAAEEERAPIMIASNPLVARAIGIELCGALGVAAMKKASVPVFHHLDHSFDVELCKAAVDHGYPSVMIDASKHELEKNIEMSKEVVEYAKAKKVHVEAEIGKIKGKGIEGDFAGGDFLASVSDAVELAACGIDSLAVGIGTAHGFYQGKPEINFERLAQINAATDTPLVLHGGTGIPVEDIKRAIANGINKVNVGTTIHCAYMNGMREELVRLGENPYTLDVVKPVKEKIKAVVKRWIRACGANGKA